MRAAAFRDAPFPRHAPMGITSGIGTMAVPRIWTTSSRCVAFTSASSRGPVPDSARTIRRLHVHGRGRQTSRGDCSSAGNRSSRSLGMDRCRTGSCARRRCPVRHGPRRIGARRRQRLLARSWRGGTSGACCVARNGRPRWSGNVGNPAISLAGPTLDGAYEKSLSRPQARGSGSLNVQ